MQRSASRAESGTGQSLPPYRTSYLSSQPTGYSQNAVMQQALLRARQSSSYLRYNAPPGTGVSRPTVGPSVPQVGASGRTYSRPGLHQAGSALGLPSSRSLPPGRPAAATPVSQQTGIPVPLQRVPSRPGLHQAGSLLASPAARPSGDFSPSKELHSSSKFISVDDETTEPVRRAHPDARSSVAAILPRARDVEPTFTKELAALSHQLHTSLLNGDCSPLRSEPKASPSSPVPRRDTALQRPDTRSKPRGLVGLANLGNTCFMNSVLQCLSNTPALSGFFAINEHWQTELNRESPSRGSVAAAFGGLLKKIWKSYSGCERPLEVKSAVAAVSRRFAGYDQQDAQEFLRVLVDALHEDLNKIRGKKPYMEMPDPETKADEEVAAVWWDYHLKRDNSTISGIFAGQLHTVVTCNECGHRSRAFDTFWDLSVPIPKTTTAGARLEDCLRLFVTPEKLSGDDACYCSRCRTHQTSVKTMKIFRCPEILVVHLKRFAFSTFRRTKIASAVDIPSSLDISPFTSLSSGSRYRLIGVVNHHGSGLQSGHYTADCLNQDDGKWYCFNDDRVSLGNERADPSAVYLAFYAKI